MPHGRIASSGRIMQGFKQWLLSRWQECVRCSECQQPVLPFDSLCPNCGQANPAKISVLAGIYLAVGLGLVAGILFCVF